MASSKPTLYVKGNLVLNDRLPIADRETAQRELDEQIPLDYILHWIGQKIIISGSPADRILVLRSSTGSGKSAVLPPALYYQFQKQTKRDIFCTQPRILTAISIPKHTIANIYTRSKFPEREPLIYGHNIGTLTGAFKKRPNQRGIIFGTPGVLIQQLAFMSDEDFMRAYSFVLVDEAHERSLETDSILYLMKRFITAHAKSPDCPFLIVMSATFDPYRYCDYLLSSVTSPARYRNFIDVRGSVYQITEHFLERDSANYVNEISGVIRHIHQNNPDDYEPISAVLKRRGINRLPEDAETDEQIITDQKYRDILIFAKGPSEIARIKKIVTDLNENEPIFGLNPVLALGVTGESIAKNTAEYVDAVERDISELAVVVHGKTHIPSRRVIIATNVAETGVTIGTLKYVIDLGWYLSNEFYPSIEAEILVDRPVTLGMHQQRRGRVGRQHPGECWSLFTAKTRDLLVVDQFPNIILEEISLPLLNFLIWSMKSSDSPNLAELDLMDLPSADSMHHSISKLFVLGAIDADCRPTPLGLLFNKFRFLRPECLKMILSGYAWEVSIPDLIAIASCLDAKSRNLGGSGFSLYAPADTSEVAAARSALITDDFLQCALVFRELGRFLIVHPFSGNLETQLSQWCDENRVNFAALNEAIEIRDSTIETLAAIGLNPFANRHRSLAAASDLLPIIRDIKQCIYEGFKLNLAVWDTANKKYFSLNTGTMLDLRGDNISNAVDLARFGDVNPKYVIYDQLTFLNRGTGIYVPKAGRLCLLDGWIAIDNKFA